MPVTPSPAYHAVYSQILARIMAGHYRPAGRIGVSELGQSLHVSTTPVREALRQLVGRDIVVDRHREGFYLAPLSARTIADLYQAHGRVLDHALRKAALEKVKGKWPTDRWGMFDQVTALTDNAAISATRRYLADRLSVLRGYELPATGNAGHRPLPLSQALKLGDRAEARRISRAFHLHCAKASEQLSRAYEAGK
ncbi:MAG: GntR family transcriptional regulator [Sphingobium sp.]